MTSEDCDSDDSTKRLASYIEEELLREDSDNDDSTKEIVSCPEEELLSDNGTLEAQVDVNGVSLSPNHSKTKLSPRKRQSVSNNSGKSRKKGRCGTFCNRESSASRPPRPKGKNKYLEEVIEESVLKAIKILWDRLNRRIDNMPDIKSFMRVCSALSVDLNLIRSQWPVLSTLINTKDELKEIKQKMKESKGTNMEMQVKEEMKNRLRDILMKIKNLDEQRQADIKKVDNLVEDFITERISPETLKKEFFAKFPLLIQGNGPTANEDQGNSLKS